MDETDCVLKLSQRRRVAFAMAYIAGWMSAGVACLGIMAWANHRHDQRLEYHAKRSLLINLAVGMGGSIVFGVAMMIAMFLDPFWLFSWRVWVVAVGLLWGLLVLMLNLWLARQAYAGVD